MARPEPPVKVSGEAFFLSQGASLPQWDKRKVTQMKRKRIPTEWFLGNKNNNDEKGIGHTIKPVVCILCATVCSLLVTSCGNAKNDETPRTVETTVSVSSVPAIFAKAEEACEDGNVALCGFYVGMDKSDAETLVKHYRLKDDEYFIIGDPVWKIKFSLKGIRRITKGGNTKEELFQAIANQVGDFKGFRGSFLHETIDGFVVLMSDSGVDMREREGRHTIEDRAREKTVTKSSSRDVQNLLASMVRIPGKPFLMGKFEVTQAQWAAVMGHNPSGYPDSDYPVENVSWDDCQEFLKKLNALPAVKNSGKTFRLPTEEEWEFACRSGATGEYCKLANGTEIMNDTLNEVAWYQDNSNWRPHPVGQKQPNAFGLYDMLGNVDEWTSTADGEYRVYRGGGCDDSAAYCESSNRHRNSPSNRDLYLGFRLCASGRAD